MSNLIVQKNPKSPISEAYRTLRTNIQFASFDSDIQTILVTSSGPSEGKSTTVGNLGLTLAESGKKVLIIDCDLRKPSIHKKFKISNLTGLSNILVEDIKLENACVIVVDNLYVLPAGTIPPNPVEMLASKKMKNFIESMKRDFDYIIIDTPPVIAVTDAQILSTMSDGVLLVVSSGEADRQAALRAKALLEKVKANLLGVVLNKVEIKSRRDYNSYYAYGEAAEGRKGK